MGHAGRARRCPMGCAGELTSIPGGGAAPTYWTRVAPDGTWASSKDPPESPRERVGLLTYACSGCRSTLRIVESVRHDG
jgi:hypothetical protein